ncbi:helix-turn-helix transcriptional regulator [Actinokineospora enzanensis]|uniref:helix-turn-helix transcriptional regulator n=1 Tax=Actinokineospora enzanensis TaxID=155975 RepID=UPI00037FA37D|nr:LuxR family transcriptional regulator [Actinokineospora enzanensis]
MTLVERHEELAALGGLLDACGRGRGQVALIGGGVAAGKTALLHAFADRAAAVGATPLTATGSPAERTVPFGVLRQLCQCLPGAASADALHPLAALAATTADDPRSLGPDGARVLDGVCAVLLEVSRTSPVVIGVDDVQFADPQSHQALLYLRRRMRLARLLMVFTECTLPRATPSAFRAEITGQPGTTHLRLAPLTRAGIAALLADRLDSDVAQTLASAYHALSGGSPLLANALIEDYRAAARACAVVDPVVGHEFGHAVLACLHRWDPTVARVAGGLALLDRMASTALVSDLIEVPHEAATQAIEVLEHAGLLKTARFRHAVSRLAVLDSITPADRSTLHTRAARLLNRDGAPTHEITHHLIAADTRELAGEPWAVESLHHAAQEDLSTDRLDSAIQHLSLAALLSTDETERADLTTQLLRVEWRRNPSAAVRHLPALREALAADRLSPQNIAHLAKFLLWYGHTDELATTLHRIAPASSGQFNLVAQWLSFLYPVGGHTPRGTSRLDSSDPWSRASAMLHLLRTGGPHSEIASAAEHVLRNCELGEQPLGAQLSALTALIHTDRIDRAAHWAETLFVESGACAARTWIALFGALRAEIALRQGDLPGALDHATAAFDQLTPSGWGVAIGLPLSTALIAATAMGAYDRAAALVRTPVPDAMADTQFGLLYLNARANHYLATDRLHAALADFQRCGELMSAWNLDLPGLAAWRAGAALAQLRLGNRELARGLITAQLSRPGADVARTRGSSLRVMAAVSASDRRVGMLQEAVELLHVAGDRYELARSLRDLSAAHHAVGDEETARTVARRAIQMAKACHAEPLTRELDPGREPEVPEQGRVGGMSMLSEAERRVAVLAALGHTNREIGGKLYITVSTVEQHLTRIYRKLNVSRRTDLPIDLPRHLLTSTNDH